MKKIAIAVLLSAFVVAPAFAANAGTAYMGLDYGTWSMSDNTGFSDPGVLTFSGGYRFTPNMAAEVGYAMAGDTTLSDPFGSVTYKQSALKIAAVGTYPVNNQFDLFGKLGLAMVSGELSGTGFYSFVNYSATTNNLMYGLGGQFNVNPQFGIRLQYESLGKSKASSTATGVDVTVVSVGALFNF